MSSTDSSPQATSQAPAHDQGNQKQERPPKRAAAALGQSEDPILLFYEMVYKRFDRVFLLIGGLVLLFMLEGNFFILMDALPIPRALLHWETATLGTQLNRWGIVLQLLGSLSVVTGLVDLKRTSERFERIAHQLKGVHPLQVWWSSNKGRFTLTEVVLVFGMLFTLIDVPILLFHDMVGPIDLMRVVVAIMSGVMFAWFFPYSAEIVTFVLNRILSWWVGKPFTRILTAVTFPLLLAGQIIQLASTFNP